jgi:hypothetical protein
VNCYLMDIDGTVADLSHRRHYVENKPKNWPAFFDGCEHDAPIEHMRPIVQTLGTFAAKVIFVSGRPERCRAATQAWLKKHKFNISLNDVTLYMRADGDYRADDIVKLELLERIRDDGYSPLMAFDDRDRVVKMWRENGIPCAQVAPGDF